VAPVTAQHIFKLVTLGAYIGDHFFRVDKGFVAQVADVENRSPDYAPLNAQQKVGVGFCGGGGAVQGGGWAGGHVLVFVHCCPGPLTALRPPCSTAQPTTQPTIPQKLQNC